MMASLMPGGPCCLCPGLDSRACGIYGNDQAMVGSAKIDFFGPRLRLSAALLLPATLLGGCVVWKSDFDALQAQNRQLQQQLTSTTNELNATKVQAGRLGGAI